MVKAAGLTISWSNDGSGVSSTRKPIWPNTTISEKQGRLLENMCIHTTLNVVIPHSIIRHRHPAIIQSCYWMITQPKGGFSPLPSYIYQLVIKSLVFCLDNWTTIIFWNTKKNRKKDDEKEERRLQIPEFHGWKGILMIYTIYLSHLKLINNRWGRLHLK